MSILIIKCDHSQYISNKHYKKQSGGAQIDQEAMTHAKKVACK